MLELTEAEKVQQQKLVNNLPAFLEAKVVTELTPMQYVTYAICKGIDEENYKNYMVHAVGLVLNKPEEATEILTKAGYTVAGLPKGI